MKKQISAGGILINSENKVYLINKIDRNEWSLPKGKVEEGESNLEAAVREVKEETGYTDIKVLSNNQIGFDKYKFKSFRDDVVIDKTVYFFPMKVLKEEQIMTPEMEKEGLEGGWFTFEEAVKKVPFKSIKDLIRKIPAFITV